MSEYKEFSILQLDPHYDPGYIPGWLRYCPEQENLVTYLDYCYKHGGGWRPFTGFTLEKDYSLTYPDDPPLPVRAAFQCGEDVVHMYDFGWVCLVRPDTSYEICRMD